MKKRPKIIVRLHHVNGPKPIKPEMDDEGMIEFDKSIITIGRHPDNDIQFDPVEDEVARISAHHGKIVREGNHFKFVDHSTNGTYIGPDFYHHDETIMEESASISFVHIEYEKNHPKFQFTTEFMDELVDPEPEEDPPETDDSEVDSPGGAGQPPPSVSDGPVEGRLVVVHGVAPIEFNRLPVLIGKGADCQIRLDESPHVHDRHLRIHYIPDSDEYGVENLTGLETVMINGGTVGAYAPIQPNDHLALSPEGPFFRFYKGGRLVKANAPYSTASTETKAKGVKLPKIEKEDEDHRSVLNKIFSKLKPEDDR